MLSNSLLGQNIQEDDINFLLSKIRKVYAGYKDKVDQKEFDKLIYRIKHASSNDSFYLLSTLTNYFRDDHLALFQVVKLTAADSLESKNNLDRINHSIHDPSHQKNKFEGYWTDALNNSVIYIRKIAMNQWEGHIIESKNKVPAGLRMLRMQKKISGKLIADYIDTDGGFRVVTETHFKNDRILVGGAYFKFRKCDRYIPGILDRKTAFSYDPLIVPLDSQTVWFRMPDFGAYNVKIYDSLIKTDSSVLSRAKILILDVRNNAGGTIRCFTPMFPYICSGPIQACSGYQLCSQDLIDDAGQKLKRYEEAKDSTRSAWTREDIDSMKKNRNSFRLIGGAEFPCQPRLNNIQYIAILMDHGSRSAAELMVLYFRQSGKVRLFGENSAGAVDYLDELTYHLPRSHYEFWVATTKRKITSTQPLYDDTGIPPDTTIPDDEPDWIAFVRKYYSSGIMH